MLLVINKRGQGMGIAFAFIFSHFSSLYINTNTIPKCGLIHHNNHRISNFKAPERERERDKVTKRKERERYGRDKIEIQEDLCLLWKQFWQKTFIPRSCHSIG